MTLYDGEDPYQQFMNGQHSEVIDLRDENLVCNDTKDAAFPTIYSWGGFLMNSTLLLVCGGMNYTGSYNKDSTSWCSWNDVITPKGYFGGNTLLENRTRSSSVALNSK